MNTGASKARFSLTSKTLHPITDDFHFAFAARKLKKSNLGPISRTTLSSRLSVIMAIFCICAVHCGRRESHVVTEHLKCA